jgi:hypothetical protein
MEVLNMACRNGRVLPAVSRGCACLAVGKQAI